MGNIERCVKTMIAVAIDGPAGAGKSSIARKVAEEIGFIYVDTGALYRSIGLHMLKKNIFPGDEQAVPRELEHVDIALEFKDGEQRVILCGEDVSDLIRTSEVSKASSQVSAIPAVREFLLELQKNMAKTHNVIMDGRDIGTVVLPDAQVKVFLTASAEERANRRHKVMLDMGTEADLAAILEEIKERDERDANREIAPLVPAKDAVFVDTTGMTMQEVIDTLKELIAAGAV